MAGSRYLGIEVGGNGKWALVSKTNERSRASLEGMNLPCLRCSADRDREHPASAIRRPVLLSFPRRYHGTSYSYEEATQ
jgi:hypothetical protein